MKALVYTSIREVTMEEMPVPTPGPEDVLLWILRRCGDDGPDEDDGRDDQLRPADDRGHVAAQHLELPFLFQQEASSGTKNP